ncbi:polyprenol phosphomannose-dependent alpha 1,6 mannosyltransferase MptB [Mesonia maritima]|uniref:Gpi18-like mannosyltransferase n=1 Tax=Mesonia maritima TaxID=1793873 RepID=A0ABU1K4J8_9FLAO|nr:polyprenol phosphomannose-dependent alpha 1,6 mannosyltransferase MptB [Mesonia maritima]MDR6300539.1 Gpi18-like mannosyltransferase [Mesonia maritima]
MASLALIFRLIFIGAIPNLSQDFYRFIWDGRLVAEGINPFLSTPKNLLKQNFSAIAQTQILVDGMGNLNASNFSNYPPVSQFVYGIAGLLAEKSILGSVVIMRLILIAANFGTFYFGKKLLEKLQLPSYQIFWFILNPFIILELTGNLHFEGLLLFFSVSGIYFLMQKKWILSAILIGFSISVKLLPLLLLPLFFNYFRKKFKFGFLKLLGFYTVIFLTVFLTFIPFLSENLIQNYSDSVGLWFSKFEFNASIYYIIRWIGFQTVGWNIIGTVGKILPNLIFFGILGLTFFRKNYPEKNLLQNMLFAFCLYFLLSTTVHPWYLATPLLISIFTKFRFLLIWSFVVVLSYSAYANLHFEENLYLVALEYILVASFFCYELFYKKRNLID